MDTQAALSMKRRQPKRIHIVAVRPFTADERKQLGELLRRHAERGGFDVAGLVRSLEHLIESFGRSHKPKTTTADISKDAIRFANAAQTTKGRFPNMADTSRAVLEVEFENKSRRAKGRIAMGVATSLTKLGTPLVIQQPGYQLACRVSYVLRKYGVPANPNRGTVFEHVLAIVFRAAGLENIADPLSFARRGVQLVQ